MKTALVTKTLSLSQIVLVQKYHCSQNAELGPNCVVFHYECHYMGCHYIGKVLCMRLGLWCRRLSIREVVVGCQHVAAAVAHILSYGYVQHNLQPANIALSLAGDRLCVMDFGNTAPCQKLDGSPTVLQECL